jgi:hypothetical protein
MNRISRLLLVLVLVLVSGTAAASAGNPGIGNPDVSTGSGPLAFPLVVPTAPCPGFAPDSLVFPSGTVTVHSVFKYWFPPGPEWLEHKTKWSGAVTVEGLTYTLRGDLFISIPAPPDTEDYGSGKFVLTRSDGARISGDVRTGRDTYRIGRARSS